MTTSDDATGLLRSAVRRDIVDTLANLEGDQRTEGLTAREIGAQRNRVARDLFVDCMTRDEWPAYPGITRVSVPNLHPAKEFTHV